MRLELWALISWYKCCELKARLKTTLTLYILLLEERISQSMRSDNFISVYQSKLLTCLFSQKYNVLTSTYEIENGEISIDEHNM